MLEFPQYELWYQSVLNDSDSAAYLNLSHLKLQVILVDVFIDVSITRFSGL